jgi:hypothetical protein
MPGRRNDALAGDLLEEFRNGRSTRWYWRQVLAAIAIGGGREVANHRIVLLFSAAWSMLAPAWLLAVAAFEQNFKLNAKILQLDFPWSTLCDLGLMLAASLLFIWAGILLYLIPHLSLRRGLRFRPLAQGILASIPVLVAVWVTLIVLPKQYLHTQSSDRPSLAPVPTYSISHMGPTEGRAVPAKRTWTAQSGDETPPVGDLSSPTTGPRNAITDMNKSALLVRLPFLLCVLCSLWQVTSPQRKRSQGITV